MVSGDRLDLCQISNGSTVGAFESSTGHYDFKSTDIENFKPGSYTFEITGTIGDLSDSATFTMTLVDPCPTTILSINDDVFSDINYLLRDESSYQEWTLSQILISET